MNKLDALAFANLFNEVYARCFGHTLDKPLSEPECRRLSNEIEEKTGLIIGWKSLKNYAAFVLDERTDKQVNPSAPTLDTLARYVFSAPVTSEAQRKKKEAHYPYWFRYRDQFRDNRTEPAPAPKRSRKRQWISAGSAFFILTLFSYLYFQAPKPRGMVEDFHSLQENYLGKRGWFLLSREPVYWNRRGDAPGQLTLFTLEGDNWPQTNEAPAIHNVLVRKIQKDCFSTEVHLADFVPGENWQQAGLLLMEDTSYTGKCIRLSIAYNGFFGGYSRPAEIIVQAIASYGKGHQNLEEVIHQPLFVLDSVSKKELIAENMRNSAIRIEKQGKKFRFLYSASPVENFSFKELGIYDFDLEPKFVGIFALRGYVDTSSVLPVRVKFFQVESQPCD